MLVSVLLLVLSDVDLPCAVRLPGRHPSNWHPSWEAWLAVMSALTVFGETHLMCALERYVAERLQRWRSRWRDCDDGVCVAEKWRSMEWVEVREALLGAELFSRRTGSV
jgi:hypothetical protein